MLAIQYGGFTMEYCNWNRLSGKDKTLVSQLTKIIKCDSKITVTVFLKLKMHAVKWDGQGLHSGINFIRA